MHKEEGKEMREQDVAAPGHLPCRRAPFLLKKVLPGQMGGPDVLEENTGVREA